MAREATNFEQSKAVKVHTGIAAGEQTERTGDAEAQP